MWNNGHDTYLESRVLSADPIELVNMLYEACTVAVREARYHLAEGRIAERSREINKACAILVELTVSLDHERGAEISRRLAQLYDYMQRRLLDANMQQAEAPLTEVLGLLSTLSEAWAGVRVPAARAEMQAPTERAQAPNAEAASPYADAASPYAAAATEWAQAQGPYAAAASPYAEAASPWAQAASPYADAVSPWAQAASPDAANPWAQASGPWAEASLEEAAVSRSHAWSL